MKEIEKKIVKSVGRPSLGVTKKVSLTLHEIDWIALEQRSKNNKSKYLRKLVTDDLNKQGKPQQMIYYKDKEHNKHTAQLLNAFGEMNVNDDIYYGVFAYLAASSGKVETILQCIDADKTLDIKKLLKLIKPFSTSEQNLIKLALQLFTSGVDDTPISDVLGVLDKPNAKVVLEALKMRYRV